METSPTNSSQSRFARLISLLMLAALILLQFGCEELFSDAKGKISNFKCASGVKLVDGELDYGVTVSLSLLNVGKAGVIKITPLVSTSEGDLKREQTLQFDAQESKDLSYFFAEPTVNATGVQCRLKVYPNADK